MFLNYRVEIDVFPLLKQINGRNYTLYSVFKRIILHRSRLIFEGLNIESVKLDDVDVTYSYINRYITIRPDVHISKDEEFEIYISYSGKPKNGIHFSSNSIYTHCEPKTMG